MASEEKSSYPDIPEGAANQPAEGSASRRARLRGSLGQASTSENIKAMAEQDLQPTGSQSGVIPAMVPGQQATLPSDFDPSGLIDVLRNVEKSLGQMAGKVETIDPASLDELLNVCATNVAAVQGLAQEQLETLKELKDTLANQTFYEVGIKLNGLSDTIQQAMEPTKALADLIDVLDQMVATMQDREQRMAGEITSDQLVMNLADQLANGTIDSWTFKCAYMAIFPEDHPADLLRRLVELLGTQRLTEDLFRAAYEAVQAPNPPKRAPLAAGGSRASDNVLEELIAVENEEIAAQLEALHAANEELQRAMEEREQEFEQLLQANQQEKDELKTRYEEFAERYEEVAKEAEQREGEYQSLLTNKEMALTEKESEAAMLRHQIEELRAETELMVKDMQTQLMEIKKVKQDSKPSAEPAPKGQSSSFFDTAPAPPKPNSTFEPAVSVSEREIATKQAAQQAAPTPAPAQPQAQAPAPAPAQPQAQAPAQPAPQPAPAPVQQAPAAPASVPGAPTTGLTSGPGSYGSGVRAQVFEVIVRQALAGAHWREICAGPMQVNNISPEEVEAEVKRRQALLNK
ncbi:MAG: hypothetical protein K2Y22_02840 [Candidatus Obscuribacterales bacterium]|nr:hypothetical protein [Candidatus Obscuribacterales bacterium]